MHNWSKFHYAIDVDVPVLWPLFGNASAKMSWYVCLSISIATLHCWHASQAHWKNLPRNEVMLACMGQLKNMYS